MATHSYISKYTQIIQQNIDQAYYLAELIENKQELELVVPVSLNIVCFRYISENLSEEKLNDLNAQLLMHLWLNGMIPSYTTLNGKYTLRVSITNHRSIKEDFNNFVEEVVRIGNSVLSNQIE